MQRWQANGAAIDSLPAPFGEAWGQPLGAGLGDVFVWCVPADRAAALLNHSDILDGDDWSTIGRIRGVAARDQMRAMRIALRLALSQVAEESVSPGSWRFSRTSYGKPHVAAGLPQVHFCMSHTDTLSVIAVSAHTPVGIDTEMAIEIVDDELIAAVCSASERRALARLPEGDRRFALTRLWTLKEAYSKLTGTGLATDIRSVAFQVETGRQVAERYTEHRFGGARLISWLAQAAGGPVQVSVAVDASDPMEDGGELVCCTAGPATKGSA